MGYFHFSDRTLSPPFVLKCDPFDPKKFFPVFFKLVGKWALRLTLSIRRKGLVKATANCNAHADKRRLPFGVRGSDPPGRRDYQCQTPRSYRRNCNVRFLFEISRLQVYSQSCYSSLPEWACRHQSASSAPRSSEFPEGMEGILFTCVST